MCRNGGCGSGAHQAIEYDAAGNGHIGGPAGGSFVRGTSFNSPEEGFFTAIQVCPLESFSNRGRQEADGADAGGAGSRETDESQ